MSGQRRPIVWAALAGLLIGGAITAIALTLLLRPRSDGLRRVRAFDVPITGVPLLDDNVTTFSTPPAARPEYLREHVAEVKETVTLARLPAVLRGATGVNVLINVQALEAAGVEMTTTARLDLRDATVHQLLMVALAGFSSESELAYAAEEDLIRISTREDIERGAVTRVYDVLDLLASAEALDAAYRRVLRRAPLPANVRVNDEPKVVLYDVLINAIERESWIDNGGRFGSLHYFGGALVVSQTVENQRGVTEFLASLRAAQGKDPR